jgi:hypothetical protein
MLTNKDTHSDSRQNGYLVVDLPEVHIITPLPTLNL